MNYLTTGIELELEKYNFTESRFKELSEYTALIPNLTGSRLDKWNGLQLANRILVATDLVAELLAISIKVKMEIYGERKKQGGLAFLERSGKYFEKNGVKATESSKAEYKEIDEEYNTMRVKEAASEALVEYLKIKASQFDKAYYLCKSAYDGDK